MFLSPEQIEQLTGYRKAALQRQWLINNGYSFDVRADGRPVVSKAHYESRHGLKLSKRASVPNLAALDNLG